MSRRTETYAVVPVESLTDDNGKRLQRFAQTHSQGIARPITSASRDARKVTNARTYRTGESVRSGLEAITSSLELSSSVAASYIDDSKALYTLAATLAHRVRAVEKTLGRPSECPLMSPDTTLTSSERNRHTADIMVCAIRALEGCVKAQTLLLRQQSHVIKSIRTLTTASDQFYTSIRSDPETAGSQQPDDSLMVLLTDYVAAMDQQAGCIESPVSASEGSRGVPSD